MNRFDAWFYGEKRVWKPGIIEKWAFKRISSSQCSIIPASLQQDVHFRILLVHYSLIILDTNVLGS